MPCLELGWKTGLEPATLGITIRCSNQLSYIHHCKTTLPLPPNPPGAPGRNRTCNRRLRRPVLYPVELRAPAGMIPAGPRRIHAGRRSGKQRPGRGRGIRTHDIQLPKLALYQAELYPGGEARRLCKHAAGVSLIGSRGRWRGAPANPVLRTKRVPKHPVCISGAPGEIRTPDHQVRSLVLYPTELRARRSEIMGHVREAVNTFDKLLCRVLRRFRSSAARAGKKNRRLRAAIPELAE